MKWISVEERLPDESNGEDAEEYIVFMVNGASTIVTTLVFEDGQFGEEGYDIPQQFVTHWMPLPEPPIN